jgi:hypothetical protein
MPRLDSNSGGTDERGYIKPRFDAVREAAAREYAALVEKWSDEARAAALHARRAKRFGDGDWRKAARAHFFHTSGAADQQAMKGGAAAAGRKGLTRTMADAQGLRVAMGGKVKGHPDGPLAKAQVDKQRQRRADRFGGLVATPERMAAPWYKPKGKYGPKSNDVAPLPGDKNLGKLRIDRSPSSSGRKRRAYSPPPMMGIPKSGGGWR